MEPMDASMATPANRDPSGRRHDQRVMIEPTPRLARYLSPDSTEDAAAVLRRYFEPRPAGRFTGAHFERLGGGGDRPGVADEFTAEDLIAVSMLSVDVSGDMALGILVHRRSELSELLRAVPTDLRLGDVDGATITEDWPASQAYRVLRSITGVGPTRASKLMARKRPHLVPIRDSVVDVELGLVGGELWRPLSAWLAAADHAHEEQLRRIRASADLGTDISLLRVLDVLAWMVGKGFATELPSQHDHLVDRHVYVRDHDLFE